MARTHPGCAIARSINQRCKVARDPQVWPDSEFMPAFPAPWRGSAHECRPWPRVKMWCREATVLTRHGRDPLLTPETGPPLSWFRCALRLIFCRCVMTVSGGNPAESPRPCKLVQDSREGEKKTPQGPDRTHTHRRQAPSRTPTSQAWNSSKGRCPRPQTGGAAGIRKKALCIFWSTPAAQPLPISRLGKRGSRVAVRECNRHRAGLGTRARIGNAGEASI